MSIARELRIEALGAMKALRDMGATSTIDRQMKETVIPAVIRLIEDCNAFEAQRDELLAALKASRETLGQANEFGGPIADTIWHTDHETLSDFMDAAIAKAEAAA